MVRITDHGELDDEHAQSCRSPDWVELARGSSRFTPTTVVVSRPIAGAGKR